MTPRRGRFGAVIWSGGLARASSAESDDREVREACLVAEALPDLFADGIEIVHRNGSDRPALLAIEVFMLLAPDQHVEPRAVAEVDMAHETVALEELEVSVNRGGVER